MNSGITYYKLEETYFGDYTKYNGLTGTEIDRNFYFLRGNDIHSITWIEDNNRIVLKKTNGDEIFTEITIPSMSGETADLYEKVSAITDSLDMISGITVNVNESLSAYTKAENIETIFVNSATSENYNVNEVFTLMSEKITELENKLANAYFEIESNSDGISVESGLTVDGYKKAIISLVR